MEVLFVNITYSTSIFTMYMKGEISSANNYVRFVTPNTLFRIIPMGKETVNVPINQISAVAVNTRLNLISFIIGVFAIIAGISEIFFFFNGTVPFFGALFALAFYVVIGCALILNAQEVNLRVTTTSGRSRYICFVVLEKDRAYEAEREINALVMNRVDDTNVRVHTEKATANINAAAQKNTDRIVDAIKESKKNQ